MMYLYMASTLQGSKSHHCMENCTTISQSLNERSQTFSELSKCLDSSCELAEACASLLEAKFALKGYKPLCDTSNGHDERIATDTSEHSSSSHKFESKCIVPKQKLENKAPIMTKENFDETFVVNQLLPSVPASNRPAKFTRNCQKKNMVFEFPKTPILAPLHGVVTSHSNEVNIQSPKMPDLHCPTALAKQQNQQALFFNSISSPAPTLRKIQKEEPASSLFPEICSPATPDLITVPLRKPITSNHSFEEDVIMHSRSSFIQAQPEQFRLPSTPEDRTVDLLSSKKILHNMKTPETPNLNQS